MKFEKVLSSVAISSVSGILSAAIVIERERLNYPSFSLFSICAVCFSVGSLSVVFCDKKRDQEFGLVLIYFGMFIFCLALLCFLILKLKS